MKEQYKWNYTIKIKTKEGTYEYEDKLENVEKLMERHREEGEMQVNATQNKVANEVANSSKRLVKKR